MFYALGHFRHFLYTPPEENAVAILEEDGDTLFCHELLGEWSGSLFQTLNRLTQPHIRKIGLGFTPKGHAARTDLAAGRRSFVCARQKRKSLCCAKTVFPLISTHKNEKAAVNAAFSFDGISFYFILFPYRQAEAAAFFACSHSIFPLHKPVYIINKTEAFNLRLIYDISRRLKSDSHGRPAPAAPPAPAGGEMSSGTWTSFYTALSFTAWDSPKEPPITKITSDFPLTAA